MVGAPCLLAEASSLAPQTIPLLMHLTDPTLPLRDTSSSLFPSRLTEMICMTKVFLKASHKGKRKWGPQSLIQNLNVN